MVTALTVSHTWSIMGWELIKKFRPGYKQGDGVTDRVKNVTEDITSTQIRVVTNGKLVCDTNLICAFERDEKDVWANSETSLLSDRIKVTDIQTDLTETLSIPAG